MTHIAIIGAGLSGMVLANTLAAHAHVSVFEKARGAGGRMATRYTQLHEFDHGAQYFTARDERFKAFLQPYIAEGIIQEWHARVLTLSGDVASHTKPYKRDWFEPHYTATPRMNSLCKVLSQNIDLHLNTHISHISQITPTTTTPAWHLHTTQGMLSQPYDWVITTCPAPQASALLPQNFTHHAALAPVRMAGCYSMMLGYETPLSLPFDCAVVKDSAISWIAGNHSKPGRPEATSLLIHSSNVWAEAHMEDDPSHAATLLLEALAAALPAYTLPTPTYQSLHRWRYAATTEPLNQPYLLDATNQLAACGDWCLGSRVEDAYLSAYTLAKALLRAYIPPPYYTTHS